MKKLITLSIIVGFSLTAHAQSSTEEKCTFCKGNETTKYSSALGYDNTSTGDYSLASGYINQSTGQYSHTFGYLNRAIAGASFAAGYSNISNGIGSISVGSECTTYGKGSFAAGIRSTANGLASFAFGQDIKTGGATHNAYVFGKGFGDGEGENLENSVSESLMVGFHSIRPTFFVGPSGGKYNTGKIGIGNITTPEAKLHIKADDDEDASIYLQPTGNNEHGMVLFGDENHSISGRTGESLKFSTEGGQDFSFETGNILQTTGYSISTSQIKAPNATGLSLTDMNGNGIFVNDGGNVGIGTESFEGKLTVENGNGTWLSLNTTNGEEGSWYFNNTGQNQYGLNLVYSYDGPGKTATNVRVMNFNKDGNVGIGDLEPAYTLDVAGDMHLLNEAIFDGNVGIGTNTPDQQLELTGGGIQLNGEYGIGFNGDIPLDGEAWDDKAKIYFDEDFGGDVQDYLVIEKTDNNTTTDGGIAFSTKGIDNVRKSLMTIKGNGNVGIGDIQTSSIDSKLMVDGKIKATHLQITDGTTNTNGLVLTSDANGLASWTDPALLNDANWNTNDEGKIYHNNSYVGIGTSDPKAKLEVYGGFIVGSSAKKFIFNSDWTSGKLIIAPANNEGAGEWSSAITLFENGNFGIGFTDESYALAKLTVKGNIRAKEVKVRINAGEGADFVFDDDYKLPELAEVENFVKMHNHLPDIPSADEMTENGLELGDMQIKLLQKVEELTLYVIDLKKENEEMKGEIAKLMED